MVESNVAFDTVSNSALYRSLALLLCKYIIYRIFWYILQQKLGTPTLKAIINVNPYFSVDGHFPFILRRN
jgi:hypothetical protein